MKSYAKVGRLSSDRPRADVDDDHVAVRLFEHARALHLTDRLTPSRLAPGLLTNLVTMYALAVGVEA